MNIQPYLEASPAIQIHAAAGVVAFLLGGYLLARRKGGPTHRRLGKIWVATMVLLAVTAIFIQQLRVWGAFSPLHLFIPVTLASCWWLVRSARRREFRIHAQTVIGLYLGGVIVAGGVTFLPGRLMHDIFLASFAGPANFADWIMDPILLPFTLAILAAATALFLGASAARRY